MSYSKPRPENEPERHLDGIWLELNVEASIIRRAPGTERPSNPLDILLQDDVL